MADNIHLCDINQFTTCNAGNAIPIGSGTTQTWVFGTAGSGETLFIAMLTPVTGTQETLEAVAISGRRLV